MARQDIVDELAGGKRVDRQRRLVHGSGQRRVEREQERRSHGDGRCQHVLVLPPAISRHAPRSRAGGTSTISKGVRASKPRYVPTTSGRGLRSMLRSASTSTGEETAPRKSCRSHKESTKPAPPTGRPEAAIKQDASKKTSVFSSITIPRAAGSA